VLNLLTLFSLPLLVVIVRLLSSGAEAMPWRMIFYILHPSHGPSLLDLESGNSFVRTFTLYLSVGTVCGRPKAISSLGTSRKTERNSPFKGERTGDVYSG
jgi:hypothetical protein